MTENDHQSIEPVSFDPGKKTPSSFGKAQATVGGAHIKDKKPLLQWLFISALVLVVVLVLFLPKGEKTLFSAPSSNLVTDQADGSLPQADLAEPKETPWADAQLLKARRDTQEILAELLGLQKRLESLEVERWAEQEFHTIKQIAEEGDRLYKERLFDASLEKYHRALELALQLDSAIPEYAEHYFQEGEKLLSQNQAANAIESLELSIQLIPGSPALTLLQQAQVRDELLAFIAESEGLARDESRLEEALVKLNDAKALDSLYAPLDSHIQAVKQKIQDRDFRQYMSQGYAALAQNDYEQASSAFKQASGLSPDASVTREALQQVEAAKLNTERQSNLDQALALEAAEDWQAALQTYSRLLASDPSLTAAQLGKLRSQARFELDTDIQQVLAHPLALQSDAKWKKASQTLIDARKILQGGQRLNQQISQLETLLSKARTPIVLKLNSDGLTDVEIYRVGKLGTFIEQAMKLNPGKYVIVGRRNGYQDVRVDLAIDGSKPEVMVPVICAVAI